MRKNKTAIKCITIKQEQEEFLIKEDNFKLSKFVQYKLDEYIKMRFEYKEFMEKEVKNEKTIE